MSAAPSAPERGKRRSLTRGLLCAVAFLTRVPVQTEFDAVDVGRATAFFPVVGAAIGACQAGLLWALSLHAAWGGWPEPGRPIFPAPLAALALVGAGVWITGAMHLDGLADAADGFGGGRSREEVLRIMRDSRIGAFGAIALILVLAFKTVALSTLIERQAALTFLVVAPALGRWASVTLAHGLPYARAEGGLGEAVTRHGGRPQLVVATLFAAVIAAGVAGARSALAWVAVLTVAAALWRLSRRRIGGITGDVLGAATELAETAVLLVGVVATS